MPGWYKHDQDLLSLRSSSSGVPKTAKNDFLSTSLSHQDPIQAGKESNTHIIFSVFTHKLNVKGMHLETLLTQTSWTQIFQAVTKQHLWSNTQLSQFQKCPSKQYQCTSQTCVVTSASDFWELICQNLVLLSSLNHLIFRYMKQTWPQSQI